MKTYWKEILEMEKATEKGDASYLHKFVDLLKENGLLNRRMFMALCECSFKNHGSESWSLLHSLAKKELLNQTSTEESKDWIFNFFHL